MHHVCSVAGIIDILNENKPGTFAPHGKTRDHGLSERERGEIFNLDFSYYRVKALLLHGAERCAGLFAEVMTRDFEIVQIVGIVDYALRVVS